LNYLDSYYLLNSHDPGDLDVLYDLCLINNWCIEYYPIPPWLYKEYNYKEYNKIGSYSQSGNDAMYNIFSRSFNLGCSSGRRDGLYSYKSTMKFSHSS
jgi:hypothetical protein